MKHTEFNSFRVEADAIYNAALVRLKETLAALPDQTLNCTYPDEDETQNFDAMYAYEWYDTLDGSQSVQERRILAIRLRNMHVEMQLEPLDYEAEYEEDIEDPWKCSLLLDRCGCTTAFNLTMDSLLVSLDSYLTSNK